jgi:hypothetical protein
MVAAKVANLSQGGERRGEDFKWPFGPLKEPPITINDAAEKLNIGRRTVMRARGSWDKGNIM